MKILTNISILILAFTLVIIMTPVNILPPIAILTHSDDNAEPTLGDLNTHESQHDVDVKTGVSSFVSQLWAVAEVALRTEFLA